MSKPTFPWPRFQWWLTTPGRYAQLGPAECRRQLAEMAGVEVSLKAVEHRASRLGLRCRPEVSAAARQGQQQAPAYRVPSGDESKGKSRRRRYCPACGAFTFRVGETVCPARGCGAAISLDAKGDPVYPLMPT